MGFSEKCPKVGRTFQKTTFFIQVFLVLPKNNFGIYFEVYKRYYGLENVFTKLKTFTEPFLTLHPTTFLSKSYEPNIHVTTVKPRSSYLCYLGMCFVLKQAGSQCIEMVLCTVAQLTRGGDRGITRFRACPHDSTGRLDISLAEKTAVKGGKAPVCEGFNLYVYAVRTPQHSTFFSSPKTPHN